MTSFSTTRRPVPSLFISHGAPTLAVVPGQAGPALAGLGERLKLAYPELRGIVVMSPHWVTEVLAIQTHGNAPILHDFSGFPESLYRLEYPAPGSSEMAVRVADLLQQAGLMTAKEPRRGLDHGAWVPLRYLFPSANLPVIQVSMPYPRKPSYYFGIGEALREMAGEGYLILGSGGLTHNLGHYRGQPEEAEALPYLAPFVDWFNDHLMAWDLEALFDYRRRAPNADLAHPMDDHLMPMYFAMGAGASAHASHLHASVSHGILAMDIFSFGEIARA